MSRKRSLNDRELDEFAQMDEAEWDNFLKDNSDDDPDYETSSEQISTSESDQDSIQPPVVAEWHEIENELPEEPNLDAEWVDLEEEPPNFNFLVNDVGLKFQGQITMEYLVNLFFSDEFVRYLVQQTNLYATQKIAENPLTRSSRLTRWVDTTPNELRLFFGLLLHMGPCSFPSIEHYWSQNIMYKMPFWGQVMSRNRFQLLLRFLHFADNTEATEDRLYKIRPVLDHFNKIMEDHYVPDKNVCIDESMILWRGRLFFRQYIKNKKHKYGIKLYELCESAGMVLKIKVYCGKSEPTENDLGHAASVVLHLMEKYLDKGYILYTDNFYNSVGLTNNMTARKTYICGTLRSNRKGNPKYVVSKKLKKGECIWQRRKSVVVCKWKDKREVLTISNLHKVQMVQVRNKNGKVSMKPNIIKDYNAGMSGIDQSDQMLSYYSALRKTIRWPKKIALHILELYIHNTYLLFRKSTGSKIKSLKFREMFVSTLLGDKMPTYNRVQRGDFHYLEAIPPTEKKQRPTRACRVCTSKKVRRETRYFCPACDENPALCVENCFKDYHLN
ncbi:piggyBac transposable element-derived protein 4-like [Sitophilus oryzae]|uniref:PiggyBac transposable element-derived protein 4-like n=1 Tax=Sitophilus oryzae TaxID=7048 RepID=A0A6J2X917_SITOR|nr:piggyBac transposable element-derived protein 4-like [Sitophilus oryzae]